MGDYVVGGMFMGIKLNLMKIRAQRWILEKSGNEKEVEKENL